jgi:hypothetical protein
VRFVQKLAEPGFQVEFGGLMRVPASLPAIVEPHPQSPLEHITHVGNSPI